MDSPRGYGNPPKGSPKLTIQDYKDKLGRMESTLMVLQIKLKAKETENSELKQRLQFSSHQPIISNINTDEKTTSRYNQLQDELIKLKMQNQELVHTIDELKFRNSFISSKQDNFSKNRGNGIQITSDISTRYQNSNDLAIHVDKITKERDQLNNRIKQLENEKLHDQAEINDLKRALKEQESDVPSIQIDQMDGILRENSVLKQKIKELLEENTRVHKENLELKENLDNIKFSDNNEKIRLNERIRSLESMITDLKNKMDKETAVAIEKPSNSGTNSQIQTLKKEISKLRDINDQQSIELQDVKAQLSQMNTLEKEIRFKDAKIEELEKKLAEPQSPTDSKDHKAIIDQLTKENSRLKAELRVKGYSNNKNPSIDEIEEDAMRDKVAKYENLVTLYNEITNRYNILSNKTRDYDDKSEIILKLQKRVSQAEIDEQDFKRACYNYQQQISTLEKKLKDLYSLIRAYSVKYGIEFVEIPDYEDYISNKNIPSIPTIDTATQQRILKLENDVKELQNKLKMEEDSNIKLKDLMNSKEIEIKSLRLENSQLRESFIAGVPSPPSHEIADPLTQTAEIVELKRKIVGINEQRDKDLEEINKLIDDNSLLAKANKKLADENELLRQQNLELTTENRRLLDELSNMKPRNKDSDIKEQTQEMEKFIEPSFNLRNNNEKPNNDNEKAQQSQQELEKLKLQLQQNEQTAKQNIIDINNYKKQISEKDQTILRLNDDLIKLRNDILERDENIKKLTDELKNIKQKSTNDSKSFDNLSQDLNNKIKNQNEYIEQCNKDLNKLKMDLQESLKVNSDLNNTIQLQNTQLSQLNNQIKQLNETITKLNDMIKSKENELNNANAQIYALNEQISKLMKESDSNSNISEQLMKLNEQLVALNERAKSKEKEIDDANKQIANLKNEIQKLMKENSSISDLKAQIEELNALLDEKVKELTESDSMLEELRDQLLKLKKENQDSKDSQQLDIELKDKILDLQKENIKLKEEFSQISGSPSNDKKAIIALRRQVSDLQRMIDAQNDSAQLIQSSLSPPNNSDILNLQRINRKLERRNIDLENEIIDIKKNVERNISLNPSVIQLNDVVFHTIKDLLERLSNEHKEFISALKDGPSDEYNSYSDI
ncbi:hypothetical protein TVAG_013940 [Trichomonas vaginalis G3]|uniref:Uncharacterized protein n=1 Tax=Trichomonas vaginalis (strain ATCC PRA-98 / G3) TaxID=412133 RepID=A2DDE8_TRIV3|nr:hypothetical protein TVAGG3_0986370 [Trichomonas vaginalis G3]EAY21627.1 hypothetical protein TVAG_013940 [Trichomonas vaginalis G3]KAI5489697.1 hypothetical protein TVAGG3_0986370 [Trichomonas vaginalis G3]|eukprot:XP_001582613.1 hypothetical protein [Trichomonas vaginalis G3]